MTELVEEDIFAEISIIENIKKTVATNMNTSEEDNDNNLEISDPGFVISEPYKLMFELDHMSGKELYLELCEASYNVSSMFIGDNWKCIAFLEHKNYIEDGLIIDNTTYNDDSFACGVYYNKETKEIVFAYRGSERDFDDWVTNDFLGFGADDIPSQFDNTYNFFKNVMQKIVSTNSDSTTGFLNSEDKLITIDDISSIRFTGNSLGGGLAQLMSMINFKDSTFLDGALANKEFSTYTYNAIGAKDLYNDLQSYLTSHSFCSSLNSLDSLNNNVQNYMMMGDLVSSLLNHVGTNHYIKSPYEVQEVNVFSKGLNYLTYVLSSNLNVGKNHNFTQIRDANFEETMVPSVYRTIFEIVRLIQGDQVLTQVLFKQTKNLGSLLWKLKEIDDEQKKIEINYSFKRTYTPNPDDYEIVPEDESETNSQVTVQSLSLDNGTTTYLLNEISAQNEDENDYSSNDESSSSSSNTTIEGGIEYTEYYPEYLQNYAPEIINNACAVFIQYQDLGINFVLRTFSKENGFSIYVEKDETNVASICDEVIPSNNCFETVLVKDGNVYEMIYNKQDRKKDIYVYTQTEEYSLIKNILNDSESLEVAIINEEEYTGNSTIIGDLNNNIIKADDGEDIVYAQDGDDIVYGELGNDEIYGEEGDDTIYGGDGNDILDGGSGNDHLIGGKDSDTLKGGSGYDTYIINSGDGCDTIDDSDKQGCVQYNGNQLAGAHSEDPNATFWIDNLGNTYSWSYNPGTTLIINGTTTVLDFHNGDLGINLTRGEEDEEEDPTVEPTNPEDENPKVTPLPGKNEEHIPNILPKITNATGSSGIPGDPIILDLDNDGIKITDTKNGVYFDFNNDGFAEAAAWVDKNDGILVVDKNNNGKIDNGSELLVHNTLAEYDSNNDGVIDSTDENVNQIKILKGDGTLLTLDEAGIKFISLNTQNISQFYDDGSEMFARGTFTKTNGNVQEYGEFNLATNTFNSLETSNLEVSADVKNLPYIKNIGKANSLWQAIMKDESGNLKTLVQSFVSETNDDIRMNLVDQILEKWANATEVENGSRGNFVDAKKLAILEVFVGFDFYSEHDGEEIPQNPNQEAGQYLTTAYEQLKTYIYAALMSKTHQVELFNLLEVVPNEEGNLKFDLTNVISTLKTKMETNPEGAKQDIYEFSKILKGFGYDTKSNFFDPKDDTCFYTTFTKDDRELKWLIDTISKVPFVDERGENEGSSADDSYRMESQDHFHALRGDDVIYGSDEDDSFAACSGDDLVDAGDGDDIIDTHGGNDIIFAGAGNDVIHASDGDDIIFGDDGDDTIYPDHGDDFSWASDGNDTIRGGKGNDVIHSMVGDDTFIFYRGDGQDVVFEHQGVDTLYFGPNISWDDLIFEQVDNDMVISINDTTDSITVKDWFAADEDGVYRYENHKIEIFEFADGSKHYKDEITVGNNTESITYNMDEIGEWVETASNYKNTVNLKEGWNNILAGENSDDTYVLSQEFSDVLIEDYSGNNKIVFDNENITLANTFFAYNEEGLEVWFDYFESHLQINGNNFSFEFSDGTTVTDLFNILTRDVSYTDYVMGNNLQELTLLGYDSVTVTGNDNNNLIRGNYGHTTFIGGLGDDRFESLYNTNDTYVFNINDGNDYIIDLGGNDTIQFGEGITTENINFLKDFENNNLEIWFNVESEFGNWITIENYFGDDNNKIENFVFSDGSTITDVTPYINAYGSQYYSDLILPDNIQEAHLRGDGHTTAVGNSLDNHLSGNDGDNTFIGGQGNDGFHDDRETSERYIYNLGDGNDFIYDYGGIDAIIFGEGITKDNIRFSKEPENLVIWFDIEGHENDIICISNYFIDDKNKIELIKFADGSVIENIHQYVSEIFSRDENIVMGENIYTAGLWDNADLSVTGNELDNLIIGNAGNNTFEGKTGNDTIIDDQGGNETYIYNLGDGNDHIFDVDGTDKIVFGEGITTQNLVFTQEDNHLIISFAQNEGSIFIENYFGDDINKIESFELSDGTIINDISSYLANSGETAVEPETQQTDEQENNQSQEPEQVENTTTPENNSYTYNLGSGDLYIADNGGNDTLTFGQGISLENINFLKSQTNLHIWINDNYGTIQIENYFSDDNCKIESFIFADGTTISDISDYIIGYGSDESIVLDEGLREAHLWGNENTTALGNNQDNHIEGNEGNNTFYGGGGNDSFYDECSSNETYIYNRNNGHDYITDIGGTDTIKFGRDIYSDNTRFERVENNLLISFYDFEGSIEIENYFLNDNYKIENFEFYDGTILTDISDRLTGIPAFENYTIAEDSNIEIVRMAGDGNITVIGNSQDNNIEGNIGDNTFEGKGGNDSLIDVMGGNDTYIYNIGDGNDFIYDLGGNDTIKFGSEVNLDNLAFMQSATDLNIWFHNIENQGLTIKDFFSDPNAKIEKFELSDGTIITDISNYITAIASEENITLPTGVLQAHLQGEADTTATGNNLDNWIGGNAGNNTITGGLGNDYMFDDQFTNETYIYNLGDGFDVIDDFGGFDTIKFGTGITKENLIFKVNNGDLLINFINADGEYIEGEIRINGYFNDDNKRIENIEFSDGSVLSDFDSRLSVICGENDIYNYMNLEQIELWGNGDFKATGEYRDEIIHGNSGNNTYDPKGGNDYIYDTQGGNDTYIYNHDYNNKFILDIGGNNDTIKFGTGINVNNTLFIKEDNHLRIYFPESGNSFIRIENYFINSDFKIENFVFADNTVLTDVSELISGQASEGNITLTSTEKYAYLLGNSNATVVGNNNEENFIYGNAGNNTYNGGTGHDHIEDRLGGDDTYIYNIGDGHDYIIDIGGNDTVKFGEGISLENVRFTHKNNDLQVFVDIGEDGGSINIENYFKSDIRKIEKFEFVDGTVITDVTNLISGISIDSDYTFEENSQITEVYMKGSNDLSVTGNSSDNHIEGNSGNNTYQGNGGNDDYYDEEGNETYIYNIGDGFDFINDRSGYDVIKLGEGITQSMLRMNRQDNGNLEIYFEGIEGNICICDFFNTDNCKIEKIILSDNTEITDFRPYYGEVSVSENYVAPENQNVSVIVLEGDADISVIGNNQDNLIYGNSGNDTYQGKEGNDKIIDEQGGNDTYVYNLGDGWDYVIDVGGYDTIKLGQGFSLADLRLSNQLNKNLEILSNNNDGNILIQDYFTNDSNKIEKIEFADGSYIENISQYINIIASEDNIILPEGYKEAHLWGDNNTSATGNNLDNHLEGGFGNNTYKGNAGNDDISDLGGDDTYIYNVGDGCDYIRDYGGNNDTIQFGAGITSSNVQFAHNQDNSNNLEISFNGIEGGITVEDYFDENQNKKIENFTFSDGTTISDISSYLNPAPDEYEDEEEPVLPLSQTNEQNYDVNLLIQEMNSYGVDNDVVLTDIQNQNNEDILLAMVS